MLRVDTTPRSQTCEVGGPRQTGAILRGGSCRCKRQPSIAIGRQIYLCIVMLFYAFGFMSLQVCVDVFCIPVVSGRLISIETSFAW